jgi:uncharacterized protein
MKKTVIALFLTTFVTAMSKPSPPRFIPLYIRDLVFRVEVADTIDQQIQGLMFRTFLADDAGMLFTYSDDDIRSYWMKNTLIALDIIYLNRAKQIITIHHAVPPCKQDPCPSYDSESPARYVLELRGGRARELKLQRGDRVFFQID